MHALELSSHVSRLCVCGRIILVLVLVQVLHLDIYANICKSARTVVKYLDIQFKRYLNF